MDRTADVVTALWRQGEWPTHLVYAAHVLEAGACFREPDAAGGPAYHGQHWRCTRCGANWAVGQDCTPAQVARVANREACMVKIRYKEATNANARAE